MKMGWDPVTKKEIWGTDQICITPQGTCKVGAFSDEWRHFNLRMIPKQLFPYGLFEFRARWHGGSGCHTATWVASPNIIKTQDAIFRPSDLQNVLGGIEFDLAEHRVIDENGDNINDRINIASHINGYNEYHTSAGLMYTQGDPNTWRTYQLLHTPQDGMILYIDGKQIWAWRAHTSKKMNMFLSAEIWLDPKTGAPTNSWSGPLLKSYGNSPANSLAYVECDYMRFVGDKDYNAFERLCASSGMMQALANFKNQGLIKGYDSQEWLIAKYGSLDDVNLIFHERITTWRDGAVQTATTTSAKDRFLSAWTGEWLDVPKLETFLKTTQSMGLIKCYDTPGSLMTLYGRQIGTYKYIADKSVLSRMYDDYVPKYWSVGKTKVSSTNVMTSNTTKPPWQPGTKYSIGDKVTYNNGKLYTCTLTHTSQNDWTPVAAYALWKPT